MLTKTCTILLIFSPIWVRSEENIYIVNSKRPLHVVSDKFLSISIDPAVLLTKINLSDVSLQMARHLSPAYVRIAGPSTEFVKYVDTDEISKEIEDADSVTVTPSVWFAINEWFNMANLTPVFGINDVDTAMGVWNPKSVLPLLEISDKFNLTCMWQLGFDCSNKTDTQYLEDLRILRHILDAFPDKKNYWKIVGSNIRKCNHRNNCRRLLDSLKGVADYVTWEQSDRDKNMLNDELAHIMFGERKNPKLWSSIPRNRKPTTFETALEWAKEVGHAGCNGFDVILRSPRVYEFFVDTPVFWATLLHKTLVGNIVLDMKSANSESELDAFAYCAKHQNVFNQRGAMVIMVVNQALSNQNLQIKLSALAKNMEIQSYILTSKSDTRSIYLNGEKLKSDLLQEEPLVFTPKLRRAKLSNGLSISVPEKSISFFVLPGARVTACMDEGEEMALLMEEIKSDQELPLSAELTVEMQSRNQYEKAVGLKEMERELQDEIENDEKFYLTSKKEETHQKLDNILEDLKENYEKEDRFHTKIDEETRKKILEKAKLIEAQKKLTESEQHLVDLSRMMLSKSNDTPKHTQTDAKNSDDEFSTVRKTEKPKNDILHSKNNHISFTFTKPNVIHPTEFKKLIIGKPKTLHDQIKELLNLSNINSLKHPIHEKRNKQLEDFDVPKLNSIHHDEFPPLDHKKLTLTKNNLHEHLKEILANTRTNLSKKFPSKDKDGVSEIELELTSDEVKKVLADRVKARAAKTNIRFTNDELAEIMKKATAKLKHDHTLKAKGGIKSRLKRDINMKLLNKATRHALSREDAFDSEESSEKQSKKKLFPNSALRKIIVNPLYKKSNGQRKTWKTIDSSDLDSSELENDSDLYFDDEDKERSKHIDTGEKKKKDYKTCLLKKFRHKLGKDDLADQEYNKDKKYLRLDEYFKNAKEVQGKFDDIDFSDEEEYDNLDENTKIRRKRGTSHDNHEDMHPIGCSCSHLVEDIIDSFRTAIKSDKDVDYRTLKNKLQIYDEIMKFMNKIEASNLKNGTRKGRSVDGFHHGYKPLCDSYGGFVPENIFYLKRPRNVLERTKTHMADDLPLYQHLLVKRSMKYKKNGKLNSNDSDESFDSTLNRIDKDDASENRVNEKDFELVFPDKNKMKFEKKKNVAKIIFEHRSKPINFSTTRKTTSDSIEKVKEPHKTKKLFYQNSSNIQFIPKNGTDTFIHNAFGHLHSFIHRIGSKLKSCFDNFFK